MSRTTDPLTSEVELEFPADEGGVEAEDFGTGEIIREPFDPTLIRVETKPITIDLLMKRVKNSEIDLMPDFQRTAGLWKKEAQSRLIESVLIRIPLPAFYMDATDENRWLVVDGLQRISTLKSFIVDNKLHLSGMEFLSQLNGKTYQELPRNFQRRIDETQITVYLIDEGTPAEVKFNIFKRINTGGLPLSAQEIRHALNQGPVTKVLKDFASEPLFKEATSYSIRDERMADREFILRFLAFATTPYAEYRSADFDAFLNQKMQELNTTPPPKLLELSERFRFAMKAAIAVFGNTAFRKTNSVDGRRMSINKALFETWSVNLAKLDDDAAARLVERKDQVIAKFAELQSVYVFSNAISQGTGDVAKVRIRFSKIEQLISEVLA
jgi:hypothetical protein